MRLVLLLPDTFSVFLELLVLLGLQEPLYIDLDWIYSRKSKKGIEVSSKNSKDAPVILGYRHRSLLYSGYDL